MKFTPGIMAVSKVLLSYGSGVSLVSGNSKAGTTLVLTTGAAVPAGSLVIVCVASDNNGTTDATGADNIVSVVDNAGGNTYALAAGYRNGQGAAQGGSHASIWWSVLNTALTAANTITITNTTSAYVRAAHVGYYAKAAGTASVQSSIGAAGDAGTDPVCTLSSLPAATEYLFVGCVSDENNAVPGAASGFTTLGTNASTGGSAATNMSVGHYYNIATATTKTFTPATAVDAAGVLVAFKVT